MERAGLQQAKLNHGVNKRPPYQNPERYRAQTFLLSMSQLLVKSKIKNFRMSNVGFALDIFIYGEKNEN